ncbi:hypothetical protein Btru_061718 [Bulinus truncatus]|nr:hypothetical protein Btru_061718 [Bulinus truncatus]
MRLIATLTFSVFAATLIVAQDDPKTLELVVGNNDLEPARDGEVVLPDAVKREAAFDDSITSRESLPGANLSDEDVKRLSEILSTDKIESVVESRVDGDRTRVTSADELSAKTDLSQANLYIKFYKASEWKVNVLDCCPRKQSYQCGINTQYQYLPCQYKWPYGWCCPVKPVPIRTCNCKKCYRLCEDCVHEGQCLPRYSYQSYLAVCWNLWWHKFVYFAAYLPSSCYCNVRCC